jgi:hypothetical protein
MTRGFSFSGKASFFSLTYAPLTLRAIAIRARRLRERQYAGSSENDIHIATPVH